MSLAYFIFGALMASIFWLRENRQLKKRNELLKVISDYEIQKQDIILDYFPLTGITEPEDILSYSSLN